MVSADTHATIILADGSTQSADVVIGADGVHSKTRAGLLQCPPQTFKTHSSAFRFILQRKHVLSDPETKGLVEVDGSMDMWYGADRKIVLYPTFNNTLLNFVCVHPGQLSETTDSYDRSASKAALLEVYKDFHPRIRALLNKVDPADLKVYPFFDLERLPTFASERMALIGDAAHPFTPHLAQGGAMALEDAVSLAIMLEKSVTSAEVPLRLQLYNQARYERTSTIQEYSRQVGGDGVGSNADADTVATFKGKSSTLVRWPALRIRELNFCLGHEYRDYGLSHDEVHSSTNLLRNHKWKTRGGGVRWRQPMVFGPLPGPRQDASGNPYTESLRDSTKTIMTILFTTSGTLLRNLLPNDRYYFESKDTVAKASFSFESLQNMAWLGGGGYELLALYIHGVCHKGSDGRVRKGNYCPIMFENLADPILTGREELGIPKVFSDMEMSRDATSFRSNMSWRGAHWGTLDLAGLQATEEDPTKVDGGEGLLVHKYIPSPEIGKPDADYDILHVMDPRPFVKAVLATDPKSVRMEILDRGQKLLPTLHPIISRLAELPIFEIVGASVKEVQGVADLSNIIRLD